MKIVLVNYGDHGSTGYICTTLKKILEGEGNQVYFAAHSINKLNLLDKTYIKIGDSKISFLINRILCRIDGSDGFNNKKDTKEFLKKLDHIKPDIIHLHNLHGHYVNYELLFKYVIRNNIRVIWTLHDCWSFTGRCTYFDISRCNQWESQCHKCEKKYMRDYPAAYLINNPSKYFKKKQLIMAKSRNLLTIVTPSKWLLGLLKKSILKNIPSLCINNGIDIDRDNLLIRTPSYLSNLDKNKIIVLSAAYPFSKTKGIDYVVKLSHELDYDRFEYVIVGLTKVQERLIDSRAISVGVIKNRADMYSIFSLADAFINPTLQDNFPTVNIESLAAGTPVVVFDSGGSAEVVSDECGHIVSRESYSELFHRVNCLQKKESSTIEACLVRAQKYDKMNMVSEYKRLYQKCLISGD